MLRIGDSAAMLTPLAKMKAPNRPKVRVFENRLRARDIMANMVLKRSVEAKCTGFNQAAVL
jgi:hypothetical protein